MQGGVLNSITSYAHPFPVKRSDSQLAEALTRVPEATQAKIRNQAQDFEAMFVKSMFSQMTSGIKGEGPFGDTPGTGVWRSMLTDEYSKSFTRAGGVGISNDVFRALSRRQAQRGRSRRGLPSTSLRKAATRPRPGARARRRPTGASSPKRSWM